MHAATVKSRDEISSRAWRLHAKFNVDAHPIVTLLTDTDDLVPECSSDYIRRLLGDRIDHMQKRRNTMHSLDIVTFSVPRTAMRISIQSYVPVVCILTGSHFIGLSTVQDLLRGIEGVSVTWTPLHFGKGTTCSTIAAHPIYAKFLQQSTKEHTDPIDPYIYLRFDIMGNSDDEPATTAKEEVQSKAWMFRATFDPLMSSLIHGQRPPPIRTHERLELQNGHDEILLNYFRALLEPMSDGLDLLSCTLPKHCSSLSSVPVTGVLKKSANTRLRTVRSWFAGISGLTLNQATPISPGHGTSFTKHAIFRDFLDTSSKVYGDLNPNIMMRIDIKGDSDALPRKRGFEAGTQGSKTSARADAAGQALPEVLQPHTPASSGGYRRPRAAAPAAATTTPAPALRSVEVRPRAPSLRLPAPGPHTPAPRAPSSQPASSSHYPPPHCRPAPTRPSRGRS